MQQRSLGRTGLKVSRLALGIWSWGRDTDEHEAREQLIAFTEAGGNFVDTAAGYGAGASEEALGALIGDVVERDDLVIATKAGVGMGRDGRRFDASRGYLLSTLDASLRRLQTDHVDLWQVHVWSDETPLEETLSALDHAVTTGRAAYVGVSNYSGWQSAQAATWQQAVPGRVALASNQVEYSLLNRRPEAEVAAGRAGAGAGRARLVTAGARRAHRQVPPRHAGRLPRGLAAPGRVRRRYLDERSARVVEAVTRAAEGLDWSPMEVALAWVRDRPGVTAPIVGARTAAQLRGSLTVEDLELPAQIRQALDDVSAPRPGEGSGG